MSASETVKLWPASPAQRRLWFVNQMLQGEDASAYNMPVALKLEGPLNVDALGKAFSLLVEHHESLRTSFTNVDGEPRQRISSSPAARLEQMDLTDNAGAESFAAELAARHAREPFNLETGPLVRVTVIRLAPHQHVLLFNVHHIIFDEWSLGVLVNGLSSVYRDILNGRQPSLAPPRIQYKDYAAWQISLLDREEMVAHGAYWRQQLAGAAGALDLPSDYPRPQLKSYEAGEVTTQIVPSVISAFRGLPETRCTTLFTSLVAVTKILLLRYTGQRDLTVGCPVAGRDHPDLANQIGNYVNTLVFRDQLDRPDTFLGVLERVKSTIASGLEHQAYPYDQLVSELTLERNVSRPPLFDVSINLNSADLRASGFSLPGISVSHFGPSFAKAKVDLSFDFTETEAGVQLTVIYSSALFTEGRIRRLLHHFERLLSECLLHPTREIGSLCLLSEAEKTDLISFNGKEQDPPPRKTVLDLFEEQVLNSPNHTAVRFQGEEISYDNLNRRANQLARYVQSRGIGPDVPVGVFMEPSPSMIIAMLGVMKASGTYMPLDTTLPLKRLASMINGSVLPIIITDAASEDKLPSFLGSTISMDADWNDISRESDERPLNCPDPVDVAYIIYTSGSTGNPKPVALEHRGLYNVSVVQRRYFNVGPEDRVLKFASPSFDASVFEIVMALCSGAVLCLGTRESLMPGTPLVGFLADERISIVTLPPSALASIPVGELPDLRIINVAGEACMPELASSWGTGRQVFNLYGPTEATIWSTALLCDSSHLPPSIGKPIPNVAIYVLDPASKMTPVGVTGEVFIGGVGVARGYRNQPDLTAERFVPDPFQNIPGQRMYRTGDLGRWCDDGTIGFLGRADHQVKLRGYRVELGEIEAFIAQSPDVQNAVVICRKDTSGSNRLLAYIVPSGEPGDMQEIRSWLRANLPEYMVPASIVTLPSFPITQSGKIDRNALPDPEAVNASQAHAFVAPRNELEALLAKTFASVLGRESLGVTESFFEIGGHSLLATQVVSRIRDSLHIEIPLTAFFRNNTVAELARFLEVLEPDKVPKIMQALERLKSMSAEEKQQLTATDLGT
jgi:amino acid adenylation domain-containing protein